jgi:hypothetical protein
MRRLKTGALAANIWDTAKTRAKKKPPKTSAANRGREEQPRIELSNRPDDSIMASEN